MNLIETALKDLLILEPRVFKDERGYFFESHNASVLEKQGIQCKFVQDNQSKSSFGVLRGLHYQLPPKAQTKLVRVFSGKIWDVAVDLRKDSPDFMKWFGIELSDENNLQLLVPKGFAHGFSVLSETAVVFYKCDELYSPEHEAGIRYDDPALNIDWKLDPGDIALSGRDSNLPSFNNASIQF